MQIDPGFIWLFLRLPCNDVFAVRREVEWWTAYTEGHTPRGCPNQFAGPRPRLQNMEGIAFHGVVHHHDAALGRQVQELARLRRARPDRVRPARDVGDLRH